MRVWREGQPEWLPHARGMWAPEAAAVQLSVLSFAVCPSARSLTSLSSKSSFRKWGYPVSVQQTVTVVVKLLTNFTWASDVPGSRL